MENNSKTNTEVKKDDCLEHEPHCMETRKKILKISICDESIPGKEWSKEYHPSSTSESVSYDEDFNSYIEIPCKTEFGYSIHAFTLFLKRPDGGRKTDT